MVSKSSQSVVIMARRLFVAINSPDFIKDELEKWQAYFSELPFRWTKRESLHLTLCFIGEIEGNKAEKIRGLLRKVADLHKAFEVKLDSLSFGPSDYRPRMLWANGPVPSELKGLQKDISVSLNDFCNRVEDREFKVHITLGRATDVGKLKSVSPIKETLDITFKAANFELMESELLPDGAEYRVIESFSLS